LTFTNTGRQRKADHIKHRAKAAPGEAAGQSCVVFGCKRSVSRGEGKGVSEAWCRYHLNHRSRHGSTWAKTIAGADLEPRVVAATKWLAAKHHDPFVVRAIGGLEALLEGAGIAEGVTAMRHRKPAEKALAALARYREAGLGVDVLLARCLAIMAVVDDPRGSKVDSHPDYLAVQVAKAVNRVVPAGKALRFRTGLPPQQVTAWTPSRGRSLVHQGAMILEPVWESLGRKPLEGIIAGDAEMAMRPKRRGRPSRAEKVKRESQEGFEFWQKALAKMPRGGTRGRPGA
jgi:hypothetical protein